MNQSSMTDFTEGSISKKMIHFSWPILLSNLLQTSYLFIDSLWVGNLLGADALAAVTISSTIIFTILAFIIGINSATLTVLSQQKGKKDEEGLKESLNAFVVILGVLTLLVGIIGFIFSGNILVLLGTPEEVLPLATIYLQINFTGIIFLFGYNFIGTVLRALGDSKTPIRFVILAVVLNAILDPLFIYVLDLGIHGAAYATVIAQGIACLYGIIFTLIKGKVPFTIPHIPAKKYSTAVLKLGIPGGLQMIAISSGLLFITAIVASFGKEVLAGFGAAQRIDSIIMLPGLTLGAAVNSMAGQNIGANQWDRVKEIARFATKLMIILSISINIIVYFSAEYLIRMFVSDEETIAFGKQYLQVVAFFYPFLSIAFVINGIMRASGAMFQVLILNIISFWILRYPLTYLFSSWFGEIGIPIGVGVSFFLSLCIALSYFLFGGWRSVKVFN